MNDIIFVDLESFRCDYLEGVLTCTVKGNYAEWFWNPKDYSIVNFLVGFAVNDIEDAKEHTLRLIEDEYFVDLIVEIEKQY